jgi:hypothetical protein
MKSISILILFFLSIFAYNARAKPLIIFDTAFGGDADDLGALTMLNHLHNAGECALLAVMNWNNEQYSLPAIYAVNKYLGNPSIPIGTRKDGLWYSEAQYGKPIVDLLGSHISIENVTDTTQLYREILSSAEDNSITLITVGPLLNIKRLLESEADTISPMSGSELIHQKVSRVVIMGGQFPSGQNEWNFNGNMPGVTKSVINALTLPITFSGYELGAAIKAGEELNSLDKTRPLYVGYRHFSEHASWMIEQFDGDISHNSSFDQTAVLYAVRSGIGKWWNYSESGRVIADDNGGNAWKSESDGNHRYLVLAADPQTVANEILGLMTGESLGFEP